MLQFWTLPDAIPTSPPATAPTAVPIPGIILPIAAPEIALESADENTFPPLDPNILPTSVLTESCARDPIIFAPPAVATDCTMVEKPSPALFPILLTELPVFSICFSTLAASLETKDRFRRAFSKVSCFSCKTSSLIASPVAANCFSALRSSVRARSVSTFSVALFRFREFSLDCIPTMLLSNLSAESFMVFIASENLSVALIAIETSGIKFLLP